MSDQKPDAPDQREGERQDEQETLGFERFVMNPVEGEDTDRPAEKPKRAIWLLVLMLVGIALVGGYYALQESGVNLNPLANPRQHDKAQEFLDGLKQEPALRGLLAQAEFIDQNRLKILVVDSQVGGSGAPVPVTQQQVEEVTKAVSQAFARYRPDSLLAVYAFQAGKQVASGGYDPQTRQVAVGPPVPITGGGSIGGALRESGPSGR